MAIEQSAQHWSRDIREYHALPQALISTCEQEKMILEKLNRENREIQ